MRTASRTVPRRKRFLLLNENEYTDTFPNEHVVLCIYSCVTSSNCTRKKLFSRLKKIENELRNIMGKRRTSALFFTPIGYDILYSLYFKDFANDSTIRKARKRTFEDDFVISKQTQTYTFYFNVRDTSTVIALLKKFCN